MPQIKPKNSAREITQKIFERDGGHFIRLDENSACPFLTEENFCKIQREHGEEYLSVTCTTYPRRTFDFGDFFERSLTLTCPVVAALVLLNQEPMKFEEIEVSPKIHNNNRKIKAMKPDMVLHTNISSYFRTIQTGAISILQERDLTIDERLILLGLYLDRLDEILKNKNYEEIEKIVPVYTSEDFLKNDFKGFIETLNFNAENYVKMIFNVIYSIYGEENSQFAFKDQNFIDSVNWVFNLHPDNNGQLLIKDIAARYKELEKLRTDFINYFSTVFENYLVNEFFMNLYPFKIPHSTMQNYGLFVTVYKLVEILTFCHCVDKFTNDAQAKNFTEQKKKIDLSAAVMQITTNLDHNNEYMNRIIKNLEGKDDVIEIMESLLQK